MSMEGERRADWGRREKRGMFCKVCEVYVTLCSTKSYIKYLCKKKKIRRPDLLFPIKQTWLRDQPNLKISKKIMSQKGHLSS